MINDFIVAAFASLFAGRTDVWGNDVATFLEALGRVLEAAGHGR